MSFGALVMRARPGCTPRPLPRSTPTPPIRGSLPSSAGVGMDETSSTRPPACTVGHCGSHPRRSPPSSTWHSSAFARDAQSLLPTNIDTALTCFSGGRGYANADCFGWRLRISDRGAGCFSWLERQKPAKRSCAPPCAHSTGRERRMQMTVARRVLRPTALSGLELDRPRWTHGLALTRQADRQTIEGGSRGCFDDHIDRELAGSADSGHGLGDDLLTAARVDSDKPGVHTRPGRQVLARYLTVKDAAVVTCLDPLQSQRGVGLIAGGERQPDRNRERGAKEQQRQPGEPASNVDVKGVVSARLLDVLGSHPAADRWEGGDQGARQRGTEQTSHRLGPGPVPGEPTGSAAQHPKARNDRPDQRDAAENKGGLGLDLLQGLCRRDLGRGGPPS